MQRRVDELQLAALCPDQLRLRQKRHGLLIVDFVDVLADELDRAVADRLVVRLIRGFEALDCADAFGDAVGFLRRDLSAVGPVDLVAVVLRRVVACRDHDARVALKLENRERQLRNGMQRRIEEHLNAVRGEHAGAFPCEQVRAVPRIVRDAHARLSFDRVFEIARKSFGRLADVVDVHAVVARAQNPSQTRGAEFELGVEPFLDLVRIVRNPAELRLGPFVDVGASKPQFIAFFCVHRFSSVNSFRLSCFKLSKV